MKKIKIDKKQALLWTLAVILAPLLVMAAPYIFLAASFCMVCYCVVLLSKWLLDTAIEYSTEKYKQYRTKRIQSRLIETQQIATVIDLGANNGGRSS